METNRRVWLKKIGLGVAGIGLARLNSFSAPAESRLNLLPSGNPPIKLSSNENPYGPSPLARNAMLESIQLSNRYNWQLSNELIETIAVKNRVSADNILLGAGSTEILDLVARLSATEKGSLVLAP